MNINLIAVSAISGSLIGLSMAGIKNPELFKIEGYQTHLTFLAGAVAGLVTSQAARKLDN